VSTEIRPTLRPLGSFTPTGFFLHSRTDAPEAWWLGPHFGWIELFFFFDLIPPPLSRSLKLKCFTAPISCGNAFGPLFGPSRCLAYSPGVPITTDTVTFRSTSFRLGTCLCQIKPPRAFRCVTTFLWRCLCGSCPGIFCRSLNPSIFFPARGSCRVFRADRRIVFPPVRHAPADHPPQILASAVPCSSPGPVLPPRLFLFAADS